MEIGMNKKAHFNPNSLKWLISLAVMAVVSAGVVFGSQAIYDAANEKYNEPVEISFTVASTSSEDISGTDADSLGIKSVEKAFDEKGTLVAYIVNGTTVGYNTSVPIEMSSIISADGSLVCGVDIMHQEETEYLGVRIETQAFKDQFKGRYLPVVLASSTDKGSKIDVLSNSTISTQAVVDGVNNAQQFVLDNYAAADSAE